MNTEVTIPVSTPARLVLDNTKGEWSLVHNGIVLKSSTAKYYLRQQVKQGRWASLGITSVEEDTPDVVLMPAPQSLLLPEVVEDKFDINERFQFVYQCVRAVGEKKLPSVILTGSQGVGKSDTVNHALRDAGLINIREAIAKQEAETAKIDFILDDGDEEEGFVLNPKYENTTFTEIKGYSSVRGLYNALYENRNRVVVFDDCDEVLRDLTALNILKAALDSFDERWVSWNAQASFGDDIPRSFRFDGSIVFVSNMSLNQINGPVRSRSICVDLSMTIDQMLERLVTISQSERFMPDVSMDDKQECLQLISGLKDQIRGLNIRTLITVIKLKLSCSDWKRVAEYVICR